MMLHAFIILFTCFSMLPKHKQNWKYVTEMSTKPLNIKTNFIFVSLFVYIYQKRKD